MKEDNRECHMHESQSEHVQQLAEALNEEGLLSLPGDENDTNNLYPCVYVLIVKI